MAYLTSISNEVSINPLMLVYGLLDQRSNLQLVYADTTHKGVDGPSRIRRPSNCTGELRVGCSSPKEMSLLSGPLPSPGHKGVGGPPT